ncbi:DsbA family protein [Ferrovum sp. PN-J185]|uniref:DsbA family protein n=1 Tax=Ferrovum sp. PN-J185 TaxID=1356306 RepID=UPI000798AAA2|nr:DsbA family protein [Ferrovum sp. PN-J185]KXW56535.1 DSBA-like thioredoxin domain protein [Ferrovum sp. PN-J185]MCC6068117.1 DsbA family protein [Ferrovum sp. PN-J185]MDE1891772.1 DsbA family protein [Betaproteobacteria bacterium]MDE2056382.1 DsbA family protein [Betaproteobacteria bacterium]
MNKPHLIYFADPMCSWCWGFSPVIDAIQAKFGEQLPIKLIVGGLRPGNQQAMDEAEKADIRSHWEHVHEASNQPFDFGFFNRNHFVYDTEPAARAIVVIRRHSMQLAIQALKEIQHAFYAGNKDVTDTNELAAIAEKLGLNKESFKTELLSEETKDETWTDFALTHNSGIRGFPTLIAGVNDEEQFTLITHGFQLSSKIIPVLDNWQHNLISTQ